MYIFFMQSSPLHTIDLCEGGSRIADIVLKSGKARDMHASTIGSYREIAIAIESEAGDSLT